MQIPRLSAVIAAGVVAIAATVVSVSPAPAHGATREKWIVDTDMGIDDWVAITFLAHQPDVEVLALTASGNGLAHCGPARRNAVKILALSGASAPVGCSHSYPLDGTNGYPHQWRSQSDQLLGIQVPAAGEPPAVSSTRLMKRILREAKAPVSILATGAMSNIAEVISQNPELRKKIRRIVAMAGAVDVPGNVRVPGFTEDSPNTVAEWNVFIDPVAAKVVFDSGIPLEIVPLDATGGAPLTTSFIERFQTTATGADGRFVTQVFRTVKGSNAAGEYYHWDPLAAAIAVNPALCEKQVVRRLTVTADVAGPAKGSDYPARNWLGTQRKDLVTATAGGLTPRGARQKVTVCLKADAELFEQEMLDAFQGS